MGEFRLDRLGEQIREEISGMIFGGQIKDPRVSNFLSINRVDVSGDLGYAKVYVSSFMDVHQTKKGVSGLQNAAGYIQSVLGKKLRIRQFPHLQFIFDESIKEGFEMVQKINSLDIDRSSGETEKTE
ncbi:30S ribosome-binding factor RbfA [Brucepastera parasyntrophica]|uniref:30S ribosome-binding factor RbfA n=1 Tax=Brucepastera parasyntrophica TaxID=2880008 RepID=UPI002108BBD5|nr:30S ribosome-binding factor RbfA [Brucepastera parasyntrophica]ULQ60125.1 30S ribosome-binding factor RbfA [Brucepastera parasyntrophica]